MERSCQAQLLAEAAGRPVLTSPELASKTQEEVGDPRSGWFAFQSLYERVTRAQPDLFD